MEVRPGWATARTSPAVSSSALPGGEANPHWDLVGSIEPGKAVFVFVFSLPPTSSRSATAMSSSDPYT